MPRRNKSACPPRSVPSERSAPAPMRAIRPRFPVVVLAGAAAILLPGSAHAAITCSRYASPGGSVQRLVNSLHAGQTGCLHGGTYHRDVKFNRGGGGGAPLTLTSAPGETATIVGHLYISRQSTDGVL